MFLCIELLYRIKFKVLFVLAFFFVRQIFIGQVWERCGQAGLTQNRFSLSIFISEGKKISFYTELYAQQRYDARFSISILFYLKKKYLKMLSKKPVKIMNYTIYNNYSLVLFCRHHTILVKSLLMSTQFISPRCDG